MKIFSVFNEQRMQPYIIYSAFIVNEINIFYNSFIFWYKYSITRLRSFPCKKFSRLKSFISVVPIFSYLF